MESPLDHVFINYQVNIVQSCDQCTSYIWGMEKAYMCSCELTPQQNSLSLSSIVFKSFRLTDLYSLKQKYV